MLLKFDEPELLSLKFDEDSLDTFDYSSDLLLSDGLMHPPSPLMDDDSVVLLEPKVDLDAFPGFISDEMSLQEEPSPMEPTLDAVDADINNLFEISSPIDAYEDDFFSPAKMEFTTIPTHCAPMPEETKTPQKRQYNKRQVKSTPRSVKRQRSSRVTDDEDEEESIVVEHKSKSIKSETPRRDDDKYQRRLVANKRSAQASRERKKAMRNELEEKVTFLTQESASLKAEMNKVELENEMLKKEFEQIRKALSKSDLFQNIQNPTSDAETPTSTSASVYLMMVLYSFSQHLAQQAVPALQSCLPPSPVLV